MCGICTRVCAASEVQASVPTYKKPPQYQLVIQPEPPEEGVCFCRRRKVYFHSICLCQNSAVSSFLPRSEPIACRRPAPLRSPMAVQKGDKEGFTLSYYIVQECLLAGLSAGRKTQGFTCGFRSDFPEARNGPRNNRFHPGNDWEHHRDPGSF